MDSAIIKHSIVVDGHKTSISLEDVFWNALKEIAASRNLSLSTLVASIDKERKLSNLSSAVRMFILDVYRIQLTSLGIPEGFAEKPGEPHKLQSA